MRAASKIGIPASLAAWSAAMALAIAVLVSGAARAETVVVGEQVSVEQSSVDCPHKGMTMKSVEAKYGAPQDRHEAVGQPPITRWDYPTFSVFFEHEYVIHSVVTAS